MISDMDATVLKCTFLGSVILKTIHVSADPRRKEELHETQNELIKLLLA